jgi:hypothetical protein
MFTSWLFFSTTPPGYRAVVENKDQTGIRQGRHKAVEARLWPRSSLQTGPIFAPGKSSAFYPSVNSRHRFGSSHLAGAIKFSKSA